MAESNLTPSAAYIGEPASIDGKRGVAAHTSFIPEGPPRTRFFVEANPVLNVIMLYCSAGPRGGDGSNITCQIAFAPDQAERIARTILADLVGFADKVAKMQASGNGDVQ